MASSSSSSSQRRRPLAKRQPLSRRNSSFLGSLKSIVTAPLAWFASTDDFEDSKDFQGKRRRLAGAPTEPIAEEDDRSTRTKRMRIDSPPRDEPYSQPSASIHGYLDPPGSVFQPRQHSQSSPLTQPSSTRSFAPAQPYDYNNNNNQFRVSTLSRTMSIDPPPRPLSSAAITSDPLHRDTSLDSINFHRATPRDLSMPPLSGRPSFLMRTSMTPQPRTLREVSEPPPLNALSSRPKFLHAPSIKSTEPMSGGPSGQLSTTLGSLVDNVRSAHSPVRQHSSLMFGGSTAEPARPSPLPENVIEKALHELDIYKTPLVPTRLRSSNLPAITSSNLFKSRRASNLVLMQNDKRERLGRKAGKKEPPTINETKPYAGEGGMKKLLARRKQEADDENDDVPADEDHMDDGSQTQNSLEKSSSRSEIPSAPNPLPPLHAEIDHASPVTGSVTQSSFRVGRTKTSRNHIARPVRPQKMKFSAAFDEDAMDDGDEMDAEALQRKKERDALEEAAKHVPVFKVPEGFSFAVKESKPPEIDHSNAKEPPIKSLPFSLSKPLVATEAFPVQPPGNNIFTSVVQPSGDSVFGKKFQTPFATASPLVPPISERAPSPLPQPQPTENLPSTQAAPPPPVSNFFANPAVSKPSESPFTGGVPNFFAKSSALSKPIELPPTNPLVFNASISTPVVPVTDAENPLWEGESKRTTESSNGPSTSVFGQPSGCESLTAAQTRNDIPVAQAPLPLFTGGQTTESTSSSISSSNFNATPPVASTFSFSKPAEVSIISGDETPKAQPPFPISTVPASVPVSIFGAPAPASFGEPSKAPIPELRSSTISSELPKAISTPFTFGAPSASPSMAEDREPLSGKAEVSQPVLGVSSGFSFVNSASKATEPKPNNSSFALGDTRAKETEQKPSVPFSFGSTAAKEAEKPAASLFSFPNSGIKENEKLASSPFSFGATPSTPPPTDVNRNSPFSFGASSTLESAPIGFSFSSSSNGGDAASKPFSFGQPSTIARPSTPPKSQVQEISMDESPIRDTQHTTKLADRPIIGGNGFSFGNTSATSTLGSQTSVSSPFSFGASLTTTSTFGKPTESNTNPFSFGQATAPASAGFNEQPRPSSTGSFSFGSPTTTMAPAPVFAFGGSGNNSTGSNFGQSQSGSAPGSPSTFAQQPSPFSFGSPLPPVNTSFSFGSQPASPAGINLSLPQAATPGSFGNTTTGFGQPQQPSSPFCGPTMIAPAPGGSALFTIGAAPAATGAPPGGRAIRKLPNRRGGAKR